MNQRVFRAEADAPVAETFAPSDEEPASIAEEPPSLDDPPSTPYRLSDTHSLLPINGHDPPL